MLKIKDDIDLKELEKFGFEYKINTLKIEVYNKRNIFVNVDNRGIYCFGDSDTLYDLIQANMVVKG